MTRRKRHGGTSPTVLVTGGAGFLGSHICNRLVGEGARVVCLDNFQTGARVNLQQLEREPRFSLIEADVTDPLPGGLRVERIYNMACPASPPSYQADPVHTLMTSVVGVRNLLELARGCGARFLQSSTSEVYGDPHQHPQPESYWGNVNPVGHRACYDEGKRAAETLCFDYLRRHRVDVRVARIFNTYGPQMQPDDGRIVSNLVVQALAGAPLTIYGTGEQTRSFCFVSDMIEGLTRLMNTENAPETPINLGNPEEFTINELARLVLELTGSSSRMVQRPLPSDDPRCRRPDIAQATALLGWRPTVPLRRGLPATIDWFAAQRMRETPACHTAAAGRGAAAEAAASAAD
jgi:UDP-glucuronate decarboxylase